MASSFAGICRTLYRQATTVAHSKCISRSTTDLFRFSVSGVRCLQSSSSFRVANASEEKSDSNDELVPERLYSKIRIKVKGADFRVLDSYCRYVITAAKALDINVSGRAALPTHIQKFTVLKSAHIFKKHRVQYEIRTHMRQVHVKEITGTTADVFLEYIQRNLPEGVSMSVYEERLDTLPLLLMGPYKEDSASTSTSKDKKK